MKNKIFSITILFFFVHGLLSMDCVRQDYFSRLPNIYKRPIVYALLDESKTIRDAHNVLVTIGLLAHQLYEQTKCPFFMRDIVKFLVKKHCTTHGNVAGLLHTVGAKNYREMGQHLVLISQMCDLNEHFYCNAYSLLNRGANPNYSSLYFGITPLMNAVKNSIPKEVRFFIAHGADVNACDVQKKSVRSFNVIYDKYALRLIAQTLKDLARELALHNQRTCAKIKLYDYIGHSPVFARLINALIIDRYLADKGAVSGVNDDEHPLLVLLKEELVLRNIIKCAFNFDKSAWESRIPMNISKQL